MARILNIGSLNIDYVYTVPHFVQAGETLSAESRQLFPGGKGLNQSIAMARAGCEIDHAGMIGADGEHLREILQSAGVDTRLVAEADAPTGHAVIQVLKSGENSILLFAGANQSLSESFVRDALAGYTKDDILVLQNETAGISCAMKAAKEKGMKIAFNPSPFVPEINSYPLELIDWWILNEIEGRALSGKESPADILKTMGAMYPNAVIVLTLGSKGVMCYSKGEILNHESYKTKVVDTTAAGDTFSGYFIASIARGESIPQALKIASKAASISVSRLGAAVSIPHWEELFVNSI
ncbi:MAG: ribokinase [Defluviitaleaceae bacterium]|nr:ribokinase [Defluviitaleaceae bacterium]